MGLIEILTVLLESLLVYSIHQHGNMAHKHSASNTHTQPHETNNNKKKEKEKTPHTRYTALNTQTHEYLYMKSAPALTV